MTLLFLKREKKVSCSDRGDAEDFSGVGGVKTIISIQHI